MTTLSRLCPLLFIGLIISCATSSTPNQKAAAGNSFTSPKQASTILQWTVSGAISLKTADDKWSSRFHWLLLGKKTYVLTLIPPLGSGLIKVRAKPNHVTLITGDGRRETDHHAASLIQKHTGHEIPIDNLYYWIKGQPVPSLPHKKTSDGFVQSHWTVVYSRYHTHMKPKLPKRILLNKEDIRVKINIREWQILK